MNPDQQASIEKLETYGVKLLEALTLKKGFIAMEKVIDKLLVTLEDLKPEATLEAESIWVGWRDVDHHVKRTRKLVELKAPRIVLEYEIKWLQLKIRHLDYRLKGVLPPVTPEEIELKGTDLYDL